MPAKDRSERFDDFEAIRFVQHFGERILQGCDSRPDVLKAGVDSQLADDERVAELLKLTPVEARRNLAITEVAPAARALLKLWSADPAVAPALRKALKEWRDDDLAADVIVSVGYVVSLWICVASVGFKGKIGSFTIEKRVVPLEKIKELVEPFARLIPRRKDEPPRASAASRE
jgi:hypothetical protein